VLAQRYAALTLDAEQLDPEDIWSAPELLVSVAGGAGGHSVMSGVLATCKFRSAVEHRPARVANSASRAGRPLMRSDMS